MNLEKEISEAAGTGRLKGITVWPVSDGGWQINVNRKMPDGAEGWTCIHDKDIATGLVKALNGAFTSTTPRPAPKPADPAPDVDIFG